MDKEQFNQGLIGFIQRSPTPFHAVESIGQLLQAGGFELLDEADSWNLRKGERYFVKRSGSVIAFSTGRVPLLESGVRLAGAHTDSPCLKIKPLPAVLSQGYVQLGVEVYGGVLLNPWFDRDLSIAGKVSYATPDGRLATALIDLRDPVAVIPSLAIHLDREANSARSVDAQRHLPAILLQADGQSGFRFDDFLLDNLRTVRGIQDAHRVLSHELSLYDVQPPALTGLRREFIAGARLDNLLSCFLITRSLLETKGDQASLIVCNDHEEVGSASASGAQGPFLRSVLKRIVAAESADGDALERIYRRSVMLSVDNAHAVHPNYADRHDPSHGPRLNGGPVIKINANQRYASNSESVALFRSYCDRLGVNSQSFVMRSDLACGSTIGPITATQTGISTVDLGVPTFAMHSIRELAGAGDGAELGTVIKAFFDR